MIIIYGKHRNDSNLKVCQQMLGAYQVCRYLVLRSQYALTFKTTHYTLNGCSDRASAHGAWWFSGTRNLLLGLLAKAVYAPVDVSYSQGDNVSSLQSRLDSHCKPCKPAELLHCTYWVSVCFMSVQIVLTALEIETTNPTAELSQVCLSNCNGRLYPCNDTAQSASLWILHSVIVHCNGVSL